MSVKSLSFWEDNIHTFIKIVNLTAELYVRMIVI